ncbi:MAG: ABC transporter ATP-binding protein [Proteobacteria bacterium]|nr:ABC transporter ATP-binding protein [Pseudomonadota bacterium]
MPSILLEAKQICKRYTSGEIVVEALHPLDFKLFQGELIVVLGPSGSGKSTLMNILSTLDRPTTGSLFFNGQPLTDKTENELSLFRKENLGLVFQFYNLIPTLTALENIQLIESHSPSPVKSEDALRRVGLWDRRDHFPSELSGGEQQRIAIARALVKRPLMIMCDEPTGALDVETGVIVLQALEEVHHDFGISIILITHNATIAHISDRTVRMSGGRVVDISTNRQHLLARELQW